MKLGELDKAEEYLAAFTNSDNNKYSKAMFLEIQKLKCLESIKWLVYIYLSAFTFESTALTLMKIFYCREVTTPSGSPDNISLKIKLHASVAMLAKKNPVLKDKLEFPSMEKSRLSTLMKQT